MRKTAKTSRFIVIVVFYTKFYVPGGKPRNFTFGNSVTYNVAQKARAVSARVRGIPLREMNTRRKG
jgi:hypothetical protein